MEVSGQLHAQATLPLGKQVPLHAEHETGGRPTTNSNFWIGEL
jgi:hypothetical protein